MDAGDRAPEEDRRCGGGPGRLQVVLVGAFAVAAIPAAAGPVARLLGREIDQFLGGGSGAGTRGPPVVLLADLVAHAMLLVTEFALAAAFSGSLRRGLARSGLPLGKRGIRLAAAGIVTGLLGMTAVVGTITALGRYTIVGWAHGTAAGLTVATLCAVTYLLVGLSEEIWLRGYALTVLEPEIGFWPAAAVLSVTFGLLHDLNAGEWLGSELLVVLAGLGACLLRRLTGSLWFDVGAHAGFDYAQGVLFSGPDSGSDLPAEHLLSVRIHGPDWITGGTAGFENSLAGMTAAMLIAALPCWWFSRRRRRRHGDTTQPDDDAGAVVGTARRMVPPYPI